MDIDDEAFSRLVRRQDGVLTSAQLLACGWNYDAIAHRVRREQWRLLIPRVVLTSSGAASIRQRLRAALLHAGARSALTSYSGCQQYGLRSVPDSGLVHVAVPAESAPRPFGFVRVLPTTRPFLSFDRDGLHVVSAARAVVDGALQLRRRNDVRALVAEAVQRRRTTPAALARELAAAPVRGSRHLRTALAEVDGGARSAPEGVLLAALRRRPDLPPYELNGFVHDDDGVFLGCADVVFRACRLLIEVDGVTWHLSPERWAADLARHTRLEMAGWTVLRYPAARVLDDADGIVAEIAAYLCRRPQTP